MKLPVMPPVAPMRAKPAATSPLAQLLFLSVISWCFGVGDVALAEVAGDLGRGGAGRRWAARRNPRTTSGCAQPRRQQARWTTRAQLRSAICELIIDG